MACIVGIKFKNSNKTYYFDPLELQLAEGEGVIVETARGVEFGKVITPSKEITDEKIVAPLKPVMRKATDEDLAQLEKNEQDKEKVLSVMYEKLEKLNIPMKIVDAEYTFDRQKLIYYFTADGRVDFRELVRELASVFKVRIELRQIYERDDTKMRGALAICGRPCCCVTHLSDFEKVSIKMAKVQGLSLNPQKISGCCGRLMCCLKYENDYYNEMFKKMPKIGSKVKTKDGEGIVEGNDLLRQLVSVKVKKDDTIEVHTYHLDDLSITVHQNVNEIADDNEAE